VKDTWNLIGRLTWDDVDNENLNWWADRTLSVWAGPGYFHYTTYTYKSNCCDDFNVQTNTNGYGDRLNDWFFTYIGYSHSEKKVSMYVRYRKDGVEQEMVQSNILHFLPDKLVFMQGKDPWHSAFNGKQTGFKIEYGPGAYRNGVPSYLPIMYNLNPRSIIMAGVEKAKV